jgi:pimeloyl-ACP methyl ester carboxylesterase
MAQIDKRDLLDVSTRLRDFAKPVLLVWGDADRFFRIDFARRLGAEFPDARLVAIEGGRTFVSLDYPERVAAEIAAFTSVAR